MAYLKLAGFLIFVICYFITSLPFYLWTLIDRYRPRKYMVKMASFYAKSTLYLFGISYKLKNFKPVSRNGIGRLIISNHMSYLDALIMMAQNPSCFVTSIEMKKTPFLGQICEAGGCLYVERRSREGLSHEIKDITKALNEGLDVVIFPEATSSNGEEIKRFKRPLFQAAIDSGATIIPQTLNYRFLNGSPVSVENRDSICWYGDMEFFPHLLDVMSQKSIKVDITMNQAINPGRAENISELASMAQKQVSFSFDPIISAPVVKSACSLNNDTTNLLTNS